MTSGGSARTRSSPSAPVPATSTRWSGGGERLAHLLRDQVRVIVDEQDLGHGYLGAARAERSRCGSRRNLVIHEVRTERDRRESRRLGF